MHFSSHFLHFLWDFKIDILWQISKNLLVNLHLATFSAKEFFWKTVLSYRNCRKSVKTHRLWISSRIKNRVFIGFLVGQTTKMHLSSFFCTFCEKRCCRKKIVSLYSAPRRQTLTASERCPSNGAFILNISLWFNSVVWHCEYWEERRRRRLTVTQTW